jgi:hypothetical protein
VPSQNLRHIRFLIPLYLLRSKCGTIITDLATDHGTKSPRQIRVRQGARAQGTIRLLRRKVCHAQVAARNLMRRAQGITRLLRRKVCHAQVAARNLMRHGQPVVGTRVGPAPAVRRARIQA